MKIVFCEPATTGAQGDQIHRTRSPGRALAALGHQVTTGSFVSRTTRDALIAADAAIFVQCVDPDLFHIIDERRRRGRISIVEINDDFTYERAFGEVGGFFHQPIVKAMMLELARKADGLWFSTKALSERFGHLNDACLVAPNAAPEPLERKAHINRPLRFGWAGSSGHAHDWPAFVPALIALLAQRPTLRFEVMAPSELKPIFAAVPQKQLVWHSPSDFGGYLTFLSQLDVGIAPLGNSAFANGRSDVKWLEYSQAGVASVLSCATAYTEVIAKAGALAASNPPEMMALVARLLEDGALRRASVERAQAFIARERLPERLAKMREAFLCERLQVHAHRTASADAAPRYTHVRFGASEQSLVAGLRLQGTPALAYPHFLRAIRDDPSNYLGSLYAARAAPEAPSAAMHRKCAAALEPRALGPQLAELDALFDAGAYDAMAQLASCLILQLGENTLLWQQKARAAVALGQQAAALGALRKVRAGWPFCPSTAASLASAWLASLERWASADASVARNGANKAAKELAGLISQAKDGQVLGFWGARVLEARLAALQQDHQHALQILAPALRAESLASPPVRCALALLAQQAGIVGNQRAAVFALRRLQIDVRHAPATLS